MMPETEVKVTIEYLKEVQEKYIEGNGYERHPLPEWYALDIAIKALEKEPCDCISREEALKALGEAPYVWADCDAELQAYEDWRTIKEMLEGLPSVTPKKPQINIVDKIRAEILDTLYVDSLIFGSLINFKNGKIDADDVIEKFNRITKREVLEIIDKYEEESEEK